MMSHENKNKRVKEFQWKSTALDTLRDIDLNGKTFAITGTTSGIGIETARALALKGAHVVMFNRNMETSQNLKKRIIEENADVKIDIITCDLNSLQSVKAAAKEFLAKNWPLNCLILNAGVGGQSIKMTKDNFETHFGVNHVAHVLLCRELLPVLRQTSPSRIVFVSSESNAHTGIKKSLSTSDKLQKLCPLDASEFHYKLYAYSKMCNVLTAFKLHRDEFLTNNISTYVLHPGSLIGTEIGKDLGFFFTLAKFLSKPFTKSLAQGAATTVFCATNPNISQVSGRFWESCWDDEKLLDEGIARDVELQDALWKHTEQLIDDALENQQK